MDSTYRSIINNLTEKWRQSTSTLKENSIDINNLTTSINKYFLSIELNPPEIIMCDSPMEAHVVAKILSLNSNIDIHEEINEFLNKSYREFGNNIIDKLRKMFKQDEYHMTLLQIFQRKIFARDGYLISRFFEDMYEDMEETGIRDWEIKQAIDAVILMMKKSNNQLLIKLLTDADIQPTFEIDYLLNLQFSEFLDPMYNTDAAYIEYYINRLKDEDFTLENQSVNKIELDALISDAEQFMNLQSQGVYITIVLQDINSGLIYCIMSKSPKSISLNINENKSTVHNAKGLAINFVDGWGLYVVHGSLFTPKEYASFIERPLTEDDINRMDYVDSNVPIIDALRQHYGFKRPKRYPFYNWFVPRDDEWPEDATEEDAKIAIERREREIEQRIKPRAQDRTIDYNSSS